MPEKAVVLNGNRKLACDRGKDTFLMVEAAIALAIAAIPEGLPIVATLALARGMWRMVRQNALIERLSADNFAMPMGEVTDGGRRVLLRSDMRFTTKEEIEAIADAAFAKVMVLLKTYTNPR